MASCAFPLNFQEFMMKIWFPAAAALLALGFSATASAAPVSYQCQGNKKVTVNYSFNKQGIPTSATRHAERQGAR